MFRGALLRRIPIGGSEKRPEPQEEEEKEERARDEASQKQEAEKIDSKNKNSSEKEPEKGYMDSHGKPRQPKETQENKACALRYEHETETWHCAKRDKKYPKQNAGSAKSQANEHTKVERAYKK